MTIPELPQDVIDLIIQAFAKVTFQDKEQLKKLSLVSRVCVPQSQRCIFHTVCLLRDGYRDPNPPYHPFGERINVLGRRLYALLQTSPHLLAYIRVLRIHAWSSAELAWVASMGEEAAAIISACHALQTLELGSEAPIEWPIMHSSLQSSLIARIQSPQLENLTLGNVKHIPLPLLPALGSLKGLHLDRVSFSVPDGKITTFTPDQCLKRLSVAGSNAGIRILLDQQVISSTLIALDVRYGHNGEDESLIHDLLHTVHGIEILHIVLLPNALEGLKSINTAPLRNLRHISILTRPHILNETYSFMKHLIATTPSLESANVMLPMVNEDWWDWSCLDGSVHCWANFCPELPFRQLTLSFIVPQCKDSEHINLDLYSSFNNKFSEKMHSIVGSVRNDTQLLAHIIAGRVRVAYVFASYRVIWEESLNIWQTTIDNPPIGRVPWHVWDPFSD